MDQLADQRLAIEVIVALPERQEIRALTVPAGTTARESVRLSEIAETFRDLDVNTSALGVWGVRVEDDHVLANGDRVEVYRPLELDPRDARRMRADAGETMAPASVRAG